MWAKKETKIEIIPSCFKSFNYQMNSNDKILKHFSLYSQYGKYCGLQFLNGFSRKCAQNLHTKKFFRNVNYFIYEIYIFLNCIQIRITDYVIIHTIKFETDYLFSYLVKHFISKRKKIWKTVINVPLKWSC